MAESKVWSIWRYKHQLQHPAVTFCGSGPLVCYDLRLWAAETCRVVKRGTVSLLSCQIWLKLLINNCANVCGWQCVAWADGWIQITHIHHLKHCDGCIIFGPSAVLLRSSFSKCGADLLNAGTSHTTTASVSVCDTSRPLVNKISCRVMRTDRNLQQALRLVYESEDDSSTFMDPHKPIWARGSRERNHNMQFYEAEISFSGV